MDILHVHVVTDIHIHYTFIHVHVYQYGTCIINFFAPSGDHTSPSNFNFCPQSLRASFFETSICIERSINLIKKTMNMPFKTNFSKAHVKIYVIRHTRLLALCSILKQTAHNYMYVEDIRMYSV